MTEKPKMTDEQYEKHIKPFAERERVLFDLRREARNEMHRAYHAVDDSKTVNGELVSKLEAAAHAYQFVTVKWEKAWEDKLEAQKL